MSADVPSGELTVSCSSYCPLPKALLYTSNGRDVRPDQEYRLQQFVDMDQVSAEAYFTNGLPPEITAFAGELCIALEGARPDVQQRLAQLQDSQSAIKKREQAIKNTTRLLANRDQLCDGPILSTNAVQPAHRPPSRTYSVTCGNSLALANFESVQALNQKPTAHQKAAEHVANWYELYDMLRERVITDGNPVYANALLTIIKHIIGDRKLKPADETEPITYSFADLQARVRNARSLSISKTPAQVLRNVDDKQEYPLSLDKPDTIRQYVSAQALAKLTHYSSVVRHIKSGHVPGFSVPRSNRPDQRSWFAYTDAVIKLIDYYS